MPSAPNTITVDLGPLRERVEERVRSGSYASADEVMRAAVLALEREEFAMNERLIQLAEEAMADPRPEIPAEQVFRELRDRYGRGIEK